MITLLVMTDGRGDYLQDTIASFEEKVTGTITRRVIHDDSGDLDYSGWLRETFMNYEIIYGGDRLGYSGAVQRAWFELNHDDNRFTFHLEDDFVFNRSVDLDEIAEFLDEHWWLAQMALRRSAWGREQRGFVEDAPSAYTEMKTVSWKQPEHRWLEHQLYYTMTPHLYRSRLRSVGWPDGEGSEIHYKDKLLQQGLPWNVLGEQTKFGFWGGIEDGADAVTHIGEKRAGYGH